MKIESLFAGEFRGCCLITKNGQDVYGDAFGYADLANEIPNTLQTRFATASAGKAFVAVAILQLIEQNALRFDDRIGKFLNFDHSGIDPDVTVEQLLTHTSGVPDYFDEAVMTEYEELWADYPNYKIRSNADLVPLFSGKPMQYPKGERFQYNNTGYVLLAMILERITAQPFDQHLQKSVFAVCGMNDTGYYELDRLPANCANHYIFDEQTKGYRTNIYSVDAKGTGAGGAFTTVRDISYFWDSLHSHRLLSAGMTQSMLRCQSGNDPDGYYGYGVWLKKRAANRYVPYFQGCDPGVSFVSSHEFDKNTTVTLVSNYGDNVWKILRKLTEAMPNL